LNKLATLEQNKQQQYKAKAYDTMTKENLLCLFVGHFAIVLQYRRIHLSGDFKDFPVPRQPG
jgi:hypothetical protein